MFNFIELTLVDKHRVKTVSLLHKIGTLVLTFQNPDGAELKYPVEPGEAHFPRLNKLRKNQKINALFNTEKTMWGTFINDLHIQIQPKK